MDKSGESVYIALILACFALFWLAVPLLLVARYRSNVPWWFVIVSATALGWIFTNAAVFLDHLELDEARRQIRMCMDDAMHRDQSVQSENGMVETAVDPCGSSDWLVEPYKPVAGLVYGPVYLLCCSLPYWIFYVRRPTSRPRRQIALLAVGVFLIEWTAYGSTCIRPGYLEGRCLRGNPLIVPPISIAAALLIAWIVTRQLLQRLERRA